MHAIASFLLIAIVLVTLGRLPELFPALESMHLGKVVVLLGLIAVFALNPRNLLVLLKDSLIGRWLLVLFALSFLSIPFSVYRYEALQSFLGLSRMLLTVSILTALCINGREQQLRLACILTLLVMSLLMVLDKGAGRVHVSNTYDPNDLGLLFVVFLPIVFTEALHGSFMVKVLAWPAALFSVTAIALTGSRGGILALAAIGIQTVLLIKKRRWLLILVMTMGAAVVAFTADDMLWSRFQELQDNSDYNFTAKTGRLEIWKAGIVLMFTNPLLGVGLGQFATGMGMLGSGAWKAAHNSFLQIGVELGLGGLLAFCAILFAIFRIARAGSAAFLLAPQEHRRFIALRIALTGYCVGGFFLSQAYGFIIFTLVALSVAMHQQILRAGQEQKASAATEQKEPAAPSESPAPARAKGSLAARADIVRSSREEGLRRGDSWRKPPPTIGNEKR